MDSNPDKAFWIGFTDEVYEGKWLPDSQEANFNEMMFKWLRGQPDNSNNEDCVHTWGYQLNDNNCNANECWGKPIHGLCEIKKGNHC